MLDRREKYDIDSFLKDNMTHGRELRDGSFLKKLGACYIEKPCGLQGETTSIISFVGRSLEKRKVRRKFIYYGYKVEVYPNGQVLYGGFYVRPKNMRDQLLFKLLPQMVEAMVAIKIELENYKIPYEI